MVLKTFFIEYTLCINQKHNMYGGKHMKNNKVHYARKTKKIKFFILEHISNNLRDYLFLVLFFIAGIVLGVIFINNSSITQKQNITQYLVNILKSLKGDYEINNLTLLKSSIFENIKLTLILWFAGSTVIGMPFIYGIICYRGFCIGYTSSTIIGVLGVNKGSILLATSLLPQNIIFIPCMLALGLSGLKLYRSIIKDRRKENIKIEIYRHTILCLIMLAGLIVSSLLETYISSTLFVYIINYL